MNQKIDTKLGVIIIVIVAVIVGMFVWKCGKNKSELIQEATNNIQEGNNFDPEDASTKNEMEEVNFCGKTFKTEVVILNDVDVIKRIAMLSQNNKHRICENIITNSPKGEFSSSINKQKSTDVDYKEGIYFLNISVLNFKIDLNTNNIYILGAFTGEPTLLGKLK